MKTMHHPLLPDVSVSVADDAVEDWSDSGWLKSPPRSSAAATAAEQSGDDKEGK